MMDMIDANATADHRTRVDDDCVACTCGWRSPYAYEDPRPFATWHQLAIRETIDNPYLRAFLAPFMKDELLDAHGSGFLAAFRRRERLTVEYAWAIPTESVVRTLATLSPICDLGCGTGYWAKLLRDVGADVIAVDANPPLEGNNGFHCSSPRRPATVQQFVDVIQGDAATFDVPPDRTLLLCWPPGSHGMASQALARYRGDRVIYIGEIGGCTGDDSFHTALDEQWEMTEIHEIPQWPGLHDAVHVYVRKA